MSRLTTVAALATLALAPASAAAHPAPAGPPATTYAVIGDTPYGSAALSAFPSQIAQINADQGASLVVHLGDIKNGSSRCDTSYFEQIRSNFDQFTDPLIYTPGDNEWTDCHRANNGAYQPAGTADTADLAPAGPIVNGAAVGQAGAAAPSRLSEIRRLFFNRPGVTLGQRARRVQSQAPAFPENVRWSEPGLTAAVFNVPGSNNDLLPWFGTAETDALKAIQADEYSRRNAADLRWLDETFLQAILTNSRAVLLGIQADMWDPNITNDPRSTPASRRSCSVLAAWSRAFRRPVLLLNGDSHSYEADTPLADPAALNSTIYGIRAAVPNLQRVTVDGSGNATDYLRLTFDPKNAAAPFSWTRVPYAPTAG